MDGHVVPQVAGDNAAVGNPGLDFQLMVLQGHAFQPPDPNQPGDLAIFDQLRTEGIRHQDRVPIVARIGILDESLDLLARSRRQ